MSTEVISIQTNCNNNIQSVKATTTDADMKAEDCPAVPIMGNNTNGHLTTDKSMTLHFSQVNYKNKKNKSNIVTMLNETCGELKSGRLTAILGPSGAGKTSMLNVLSAFKANGITGQILLNGKQRDVLSFRKISSYIPQDFVMLDLLTVQETIRNSADLKLPVKTQAKEKLRIIEEILELLNMRGCRNTLVRSLSGGERKRLSIAIELVTNPPLMFFDEPTSGLDSVASLQVISYLQRLAHNGRIIACVVHQPSSRLMKYFDDVLIMSKSEVLYCGPQEHMLTHFERAGFICPQHYNPADFVLEVGSESHNAQVKLLIEWNKDLHQSDLRTGETKHVDERTKMLPTNESIDDTSIELSEIQGEQQELSEYDDEHLRPKAEISVWQQFCVLLRRSLRSQWRNLICVQMRVIMHAVVGILLGVVFWDIGNDAAKMLTNTSCIFFVILFTFFANAMPSILLCPQDTAVFKREYLNGWYSVRAYYLSKIISEIPMLFTCPTLFVGIVYFMTSQPVDLGRFTMCWGICLLCGILGHLLGLVFGSTFQEQLAIFLVPTVTIPFMIFSGFFIRMHELISLLRPLCDISFFRYAMEGSLQSIYSYDRPKLECYKEFCFFTSPNKLLQELDMSGDLYGTDVLAISLWIVFLLVAFYFSLILSIKRAQ